jgi:hypothetical protein
LVVSQHANSRRDLSDGNDPPVLFFAQILDDPRRQFWV